MNIYRYNTDDDFENSYEFKCDFDCHDRDPGFIAKQAADDYHSEHDGWECLWPINMTLWLPNGTLIGKFEIDREFDPVFLARKVEE
ncbi:hypothetical protein JHL22_05200 [Advenella sp. WQ 585]|uniref:Uncharacterized protein n=1 Tax=Advenella mandrilli TaxID=2800330 RepID=A0ABS1ECK0_9BURK|nr:hypothetical protein [Advenella mandrilli]MBK1780608.1 hypothetical protein [Advenella mandrilli]